MKSVLQLIHKSVGTVAEDDLQQPLDQLGIDSIDLVDLRVNLDHSMGFEIPDAFVVGYGIDYAGRYRNLPFIGEVKNPSRGG